MATDPRIERHYTSDAIAERILAALREASGRDVAITPDTLAPLDHFHGRGLAATKALAQALAPRPGEHLLDIGCGIGGPARWFAATFGCQVTGIDLTEAFCRAAEALTAACGLTQSVHIRQASATDLPFADATFDHAYSQNVAMNIADKQRYYREAFRVLRPGGRFAVTQAAAGPNGSPTYPQPWASIPDTSFLATPDEIRADIAAAGFTIVDFRDATGETIAFHEASRRRLAASGPPKLGMQVLMGPIMREAMRNGAQSTAEGRLLTIECLLRKPTAPA
jgi:sarcosine/dimethylglycine N-methyltransferase